MRPAGRPSAENRSLSWISLLAAAAAFRQLPQPPPPQSKTKAEISKQQKTKNWRKNERQTTRDDFDKIDEIYLISVVNTSRTNNNNISNTTHGGGLKAAILFVRPVTLDRRRRRRWKLIKRFALVVDFSRDAAKTTQTDWQNSVDDLFSFSSLSILLY